MVEGVGSPSITVLTATHNRAAKLNRLFESLVEQTYTDFEWLVIDDGSTDHTAAVMSVLIEQSPFPSRYVYKENGGKHTALDVGIRQAAGMFCAVIDDDDWYFPNALERLKYHWDTLPDPDAFAEVQGLCVTATGELVGAMYPAQVFDSDYIELNEVLNIRGDRRGMIRTDILRRFPFPEQFGGKFLDERIVWNRIGAVYRTRGVNELIGYVEYLDTGLSAWQRGQHTALSGQRLLYYEELIALKRKLPARSRYKANANLIRNGLHERRSLAFQAQSVPAKLWWLLGLPAGVFLYLRDRRVG